MRRAKTNLLPNLERLESRIALAADLSSQGDSNAHILALSQSPNLADQASLRDLMGSESHDRKPVHAAAPRSQLLAALRTNDRDGHEEPIESFESTIDSDSFWADFPSSPSWAQFLTGDFDQDGQLEELGITTEGDARLARDDGTRMATAELAQETFQIVDAHADSRADLAHKPTGTVFFAFASGELSSFQSDLASGEDGQQAASGDVPIVTQGDLQALIDLDGDDSSGTTNGGFSNQFTEEDGYIRLMDTDFVVNDFGEADILELVVEPVGGVPDGSEEFVIFRRSGGVSSIRLDGSETTLLTHNTIDGTPISYQFDSAIGGVVFRRTSGEAFSTDTIRQLMDGLRYYNTDDDPDTTDRTLAIFLNDNSSVQSTVGTVTISVIAVNDAPVLDLDADNSSGADPVILGRDAADLTFVNESLTTAELFNGQTISVSAASMFSSGLTATDPSFVATYFERGEAIRLSENTTASLTFDGNGVAPQGTLLFLHDVDQNENIQISSESGTLIFVEQLETISGETTNLPTWNPVSGVLTGDAVNGVGGATILDITGVSDLTLSVGSRGTLEFGFITPGSRPINFETTFTEGQPPVAIVDSDVLTEDVDNDTMQEVLITLTNGQIGDRFVFEALGFDDLGIRAASSTSEALTSPGTISVTLSGPASKSNFEAALQRIEFENVSSEPNLTDRLVAFTLNDAEDQSITAETTILIIPVDHNLSIEKSDGNATAEVGETVIYELTVRNNGDVDASGVTIQESIPAGTAFRAEDSSSGWVSTNTGDLELAIGNLAKGQSQTVRYALEITDNRLSMITNIATVADDGSQGAESVTSDNEASEDTPLIPHTAEISGNVFLDLDENGQRDNSDEPIQDVLIELSGTSTTGMNVQRSVNTDAAGDFLFEDLPPGAYSIAETQPSNVVDGPDSTTAPNPTTVGTDTLQFELTVGATETVLFSELESAGTELTTSQINGQVFADGNRNGVQDAGEEAIAGVTLTLAGTSDLGTAVQLTTATDAAGNYLFENLPAGSYTVTEIQPSGYSDGADSTSAPLNRVIGSDAIQIELGAGESESIIFREQPQPNEADIAASSMSKRILLAST